MPEITEAVREAAVENCRAKVLLTELHAAFCEIASLRRLSTHQWERDVAGKAHKVRERVEAFLASQDCTLTADAALIERARLGLEAAARVAEGTHASALPRHVAERVRALDLPAVVKQP